MWLANGGHEILEERCGNRSVGGKSRLLKVFLDGWGRVL